jgi:hypothetical protein
MQSQIDICNLALTWLGANRISSFLDRSTVAEDCAFVWDHVRVTELSKQFWAFASTRIALPELSQKPAWGFRYQYELPLDCLTIIEVNDYWNQYGGNIYLNKNDSPYMFEERRLLTNFPPPLKIRYVVDIKDTGLFHPLFARLMSAAIARDIAFRIKQDRADVDAWYQSVLNDARKQNAIIRPPMHLPESSYIMARLPGC